MDFKLINTEETVSRLVTLIRDAKERVLLISPYITLGAEDRIGRAIREALTRKVKVSIVMRADEQTHLKEPWLKAIEPQREAGLGLYVVPGLHAKIYRSESTVIITSLNLLSSSVLNTIEVGLWSQDPQAVLQVDAFIKKEITLHAQPVPFGRALGRGEDHERQANSRRPSRRQDEGYCIRCGSDIPLNPEKPYCRNDYEEWAQWGNEDYEDRYCHGCGDEYPATMRRPLCRSCYRQLA